MTNWPNTYRSDDPRASDPRFQRRVVAIHRPIAIIENMWDVQLDCGHAPLFFSDTALEVGAQCFCPTCYENQRES